MANNHSIQLLRKAGAPTSTELSDLFPGQPLYDMTNNKLYIGNNSGVGQLINPDVDSPEYGLATSTSNGLMSSSNYTKLAGIESGAQKNTITSVNGSTGAVTITAAGIGAVTSADITNLGFIESTVAPSASNARFSIAGCVATIKGNSVILNQVNSSGSTENSITLTKTKLTINAIMDANISGNTIELISQTKSATTTINSTLFSGNGVALSISPNNSFVKGFTPTFYANGDIDLNDFKITTIGNTATTGGGIYSYISYPSIKNMYKYYPGNSTFDFAENGKYSAELNECYDIIFRNIDGISGNIYWDSNSTGPSNSVIILKYRKGTIILSQFVNTGEKILTNSFPAEISGFGSNTLQATVINY